MKQNQLNRITEFVCEIADGYVRLIPGGYPIVHYACGLFHFMFGANDGNAERQKRIDAVPEATREETAREEVAKERNDPRKEVAEEMDGLPQARSLAFVEKVSVNELPAEHRCWTGNDANKRNYHGRVPAGENPVYLELHWKKSRNAPRQLVGGFILDVTALEKEGYLVESGGGDIRVRFVRESDGCVYMGRGIDKRIPIGTVSA